MAYATSTILAVTAIAATVAAAGTAAYSSYQQSEAQAQAANAQKRMAQMQAEAQTQAGEAAAKQTAYNAEVARRSLLSREAGAGVQVGEGSLLEDEMRFASNASYDVQMARYNHTVAASVAAYQAQLFGYQAGRYRALQGPMTALTAGTTLATGLANVYKGYGAPGNNPAPVDYGAV